MPAKIKKRLKALSFSEQAKPRFFKIIDKIIPKMIVDYIQKGISPVKMKSAKIQNTGNKNRFIEYSELYKSGMGKGKSDMRAKRQRPVNLTLTGKMLKSIKSMKKKNSVKIWFSDKKAVYHNDEGAGKAGVIRRMLPREGEQWAVKIERKIVEALEKAIRLSKR